jgi:ABC-2 type transport system permease protein
MYCLYVLTIASLKMFLRNRQATFFTIIFPLIILLIFGSMKFDGPMKLQLGLVTHQPDAATTQFIGEIRSFKVFSIHNGALSDELAALKSGDRAVVLDVPDDLMTPGASNDPKTLTAYTNTAQSNTSQAVLSILNQLIDKMSLAAANAQSLVVIQPKSIDVHEVRYIDFLLPGIIAMAVMQMSVFSVAHVFAHYKERGVLKRLLATPMRPVQFVTANIITRLFVALVQTSLFLGIGFQMFHVHVTGAYWLLALCIVLGGTMFLGLGFTISGIARTNESVPVIANLIVMPMLFLGNVFFSASSMPAWVASLAKFLPLTCFATPLRAVVTDGAGLSTVLPNLLGMVIWCAILITLATITFSFQERQIA